MSTAERAINIIEACKNEQQTEVATRFIELLLKQSPSVLTREERQKIILAIDKKLKDLENQLINNK